MRLRHSRGRFLSAAPAPGRTPPGPQATRASGTDPGRQGAARPGTQRGEGNGATRARGGGGGLTERSAAAARTLGGGDGGHRSRAAGGRGRPSSLLEVVPGSPGRALFLAARGSGGLGGGTRGTRGWDPGWAGTQALPFLLAEFLLEAPVRGALLTMPEGVDWLSGTFCTMSLGPPSGTSFLARLGSFQPQASALILV